MVLISGSVASMLSYQSMLDFRNLIGLHTYIYMYIYNTNVCPYSTQVRALGHYIGAAMSAYKYVRVVVTAIIHLSVNKICMCVYIRCM